MNNLETIIEIASDSEFLKADGLDDAVIGYDDTSDRLIYSMTKVIDILITEGLTEEEALDHYYYNVHGSYVGEKTPIWCYDYFN